MANNFHTGGGGNASGWGGRYGGMEWTDNGQPYYITPIGRIFPKTSESPHAYYGPNTYVSRNYTNPVDEMTSADHSSYYEPTTETHGMSALKLIDYLNAIKQFPAE